MKTLMVLSGQTSTQRPALGYCYGSSSATHAGTPGQLSRDLLNEVSYEC